VATLAGIRPLRTGAVIWPLGPLVAALAVTRPLGSLVAALAGPWGPFRP
jgi:hypothetical protein